MMIPPFWNEQTKAMEAGSGTHMARFSGLSSPWLGKSCPFLPALGASMRRALPRGAGPTRVPVGSTEEPFPLTHRVQGGFYWENN